jgi:hypothetical protein
MRRLVPLLLLAGCSAHELGDQEPVRACEELKDMPVVIKRDMDILFVVDNSASMAEEQASLTASFPALIAVLETLEGGLPDVHIGVVSSDLGAGPYAIDGCQDGDGGALQVGDPACAPAAGFISNVTDGYGRVTNYPGTLAEAFACNASLGTTGCGFEQHLESMRRALDGSNPDNAGFLRDDAYLVVVFIADEDDCSTRDPAMFDPLAAELGPLSSFRCFEHGVECDATGCFPREDSPFMHGVQEYVDFLKGLKDDDSLIVVSTIVGAPEPVVVGPGPVLEPSCQSGSGSAAPAVRLSHFAEQFPNRSSFTSICEEDLSEGLALVGELAKRTLGAPCLDADLVDFDPLAPGLQFECVVSEVRNLGEADQEERLLPACGPDAPIPCFEIAQDRDMCPDTPTGLTLVIERGGLSVPPGTHVQARCRTRCDGDHL